MRTVPTRYGWAVAVLAVLLPGQVAVALDLEVHPGRSIQAAIDRAVSGDTIRIHGAEGFTYNERFTTALRESLTLEGVSNPVINTCPSSSVNCPSVVLSSGTTLRGLTVVAATTSTKGFTHIEIPYEVQHATIDRCLIVGSVSLNGSGNIIQDSVIRSLGPVLTIQGGNNYILRNVLHSTRPAVVNEYVVSPWVIQIYSAPGYSVAVGNNWLFGNTVYGWLEWQTARSGAPGYSTSRGLYLYSNAGSGNRVENSIFANHKLVDIVSLVPVEVSYSLLGIGIGTFPEAANVLLGPGVLVGANPRFVDPEANDFRLTHRSPAIDAGDPTQPTDPDQTRADLGPFAFDQRPTGLLPDVPNEAPTLQLLQPDLNGDGTVSTGDIGLTVNSFGRLWPPVVKAGSSLMFFVKGTDADGTSLTYKVKELPSGACFDGKIGRFGESGTGSCGARQFVWPQAGPPGSYTVTFIVTDGTFTDIQTLPIQVTP